MVKFICPTHQAFRFPPPVYTLQDQSILFVHYMSDVFKKLLC